VARWREQARVDYLEWTKPAPNPARFSSPKSSPGCAIGFRRMRSSQRRGQFRRLDFALLSLSGAAHAGRAQQRFDGYGVPRASRRKVAHPERVVVSINGDGDFLMNGQELATAVRTNCRSFSSSQQRHVRHDRFLNSNAPAAF